MRKPKIYETFVRNKFIAVNATNKFEFLQAIQAHAEYVKDLVNNPLVEYEGNGTCDDYAVFTTTDLTTANKYNMHIEDEEEWDEEWDECELNEIKKDDDLEEGLDNLIERADIPTEQFEKIIMLSISDVYNTNPKISSLQLVNSFVKCLLAFNGVTEEDEECNSSV